MDYTNTIRSPILSNINIKKLQTIHNTALRIATGCTRDTNTQHLYDETKVLLMDTYLKLPVTQLKQLTHTQIHPLHDLDANSDPPRNIKATIFHNNEHTNIVISEPDITPENVEKTLNIFTLTSPHNISVLEKTKKLLTTHLMTFLHQNKHYLVICVQNWHSPVPTNHLSCKITYIQ